MPRGRRSKTAGNAGSPTELQKNRIIHTALKLFAKKGYAETSVDDIATDIGATKGIVYHYFRSKHALLYEARLAVQEPFLEALRGVLAMTAPPDDKLREAIRSYVRILYSDPSIIRFNVDLNQFDAPLPPPNRRVIRKRRAEVVDAFKAVLTEGIAAGLFRQVDVSVIARTIVGSIVWTAYWFDLNGRLGVDQLADQLVDFALTSLLVSPPSAHAAGDGDGQLMPDASARLVSSRP
ncbi:MAG: TetR/AcrR family transcriptional regulator [Dehalococcoidia bacterium]